MGEEEKIAELVEAVRLALEESREASRLEQAALVAAQQAARSSAAYVGPGYAKRFLSNVGKARDAIAATMARQTRNQEDLQRALDAADDLLIGPHLRWNAQFIRAQQVMESAGFRGEVAAGDLLALRKLASGEQPAGMVGARLQERGFAEFVEGPLLPVGQLGRYELTMSGRFVLQVR